MNRRKYLLAAALILTSPGIVLGQHRGSHGAGVPPAATGAETSQDLKDFSRAVALQASPEQITAFRQLMSSLGTARKSVTDFQHPAAGMSSSEYARAKALSDAADDTQTNNERFLSSFSDAQKSGLKVLAKKARKAGTEIAKQSKTLNSGPSRTAVEKLDKSLQELQDSQQAIAREMGIPTSDDAH